MTVDAQHAWEDTFGTDVAGRPVGPRFHRLVLLDVTRAPDRADRARLERVLDRLEARHAHGPAGLLLLLAWGPGWFERHGPGRSPIPRAVPLARDERPLLEDIDACLHLASDDEERLDALVGSLTAATGELALPGPLRRRAVRTGFVGAGLPRQRTGRPEIPAEAPLLLGFPSGLRGNQATEAEITIPDGPLAGGTTMHLSRLRLDLDAWYGHGADHRAQLMYAPTVDAARAATLVDDARTDSDRLPQTAAEHGLAGHAQAAARARLDDRPRISRRDFATLDDAIPGTHFIALQRRLEDFNATRAVMNAADARTHHPAIGHRDNNGINGVMTVLRRATFAVPPRSARAFPVHTDDTRSKTCPQR